MENDRKTETPKQSEKKLWIKPSATVEDVAKVTKASNHNFNKSDGATCQS